MQYKTPKIYAAVKYNNDRRHRSNFNQRKSAGVMMKPLLALVALLFVCGGTVGYFFYYDKKNTKADTPRQNNTDQSSNVTLKPIDKRVETWWNNEYRFYQKINVQNVSVDNSLPSNGVVSAYFNHTALVQAGKSTQSGKDIRVLYLDRNNKFHDLPFDIVNPNSDHSEIRFSLFDPIGIKESDNYFYVYYGNPLREDSFKLSSVARSIESQNYNAVFGEEVRHPLDIDISRKWVLRGGNSVPPSYKSSKVTFTQPVDKSVLSATVSVFDQNARVVQSLPMVKGAGNSFSQDLNVSALELGDYTVQVSAVVDGVQENSPKQKFHISRPLYVNWTIDWEGDDVQDKWLQMAEKVSADYKVPMTHYFNPRIYVGLSAERAKYLTNWVLNRKSKNGDEIALHLHMWYDMVKAMGLTDKHEPNWAGGATGHDVLTTAYTAEEFDKMIEWSLRQFSDHGLPRPTYYRAGGWQINADLLKVLVKYGFKVDSSGREYIKFGTKLYPVPWTLYPTTKPFKPSATNINVAGKDPIGIWEFPNNGDNSSNNGANSTKIIDNFKLNFTGDALKDKQTFVILSHMQYFSNDDPVIRRTFTEIGKYVATNDSGPVIYTTIDTILPEYEAGI